MYCYTVFELWMNENKNIPEKIWQILLSRLDCLKSIPHAKRVISLRLVKIVTFGMIHFISIFVVSLLWQIQIKTKQVLLNLSRIQRSWKYKKQASFRIFNWIRHERTFFFGEITTNGLLHKPLLLYHQCMLA